MADASGQLLNQPWQISNGNLVYTLPGPGFHVEFYVDRAPAGAQREIAYAFEAPYQIQSLEVIVQQPTRATGFSVAPAAEGSSQGTDGFTYYRLTRANLAPASKLPLTIRYTKANQGLSVIPQQPVAAPTASAAPILPATQGTGNLLPYFLIGLGLLALVGAAGYWFLQKRSSVKPVQPIARPQASSGRTTAGSKAAFCSQCGNTFGPDDRFCSKCGALRKS